MPSYRDILNKYGIHPRRRFGQNFLVDEKYLDTIVEAAGISDVDTVIEIGAGLGNLTVKLAAKADKVIAIEFDRDMAKALRGELAARNIEIVEEDALRIDYHALVSRHVSAGAKAKAVANLPYNIATEIIFRLLDARDRFSTMLLMTQLEVARRITSEVGTKDYGVLAILTNIRANTRIELIVPAGAFRPKPRVDSAVVRFDMLDRPKVDIGDEKRFRMVVRGAFGQRRKTLANALSAGNPFGFDRDAVKIWLTDCDISPDRRAETLTMEEFARLANYKNT